MIAKELSSIKASLPETVQLIAVSKTKPSAAILEAYEVGQRAFGENKVQEMLDKYTELPKDIQWHMIGHLQTNKVKFIAPFVHLIHAVDSLKLLKEIDKEGGKNQRTINCLLQFHIASEETKFGLDLSEATELLESAEFQSFKHVKIIGVMGMASFSDDQAQVSQEFRSLNEIFKVLKSDFFKLIPDFKEISMGMSGDFKLAVAEGSTMVRIGSTIFGGR